jgi:hypothetical protein
LGVGSLVQRRQADSAAFLPFFRAIDVSLCEFKSGD